VNKSVTTIALACAASARCYWLLLVRLCHRTALEASVTTPLALRSIRTGGARATRRARRGVRVLRICLASRVRISIPRAFMTILAL
jgi:hypothetical protein